MSSQLNSLKDAAQTLSTTLTSKTDSEPFLDIPSLNALSLTYITSHLLTSSYPHPNLELPLKNLFNLRHPNHLIYNLSEKEYRGDTILENYVECTFPGHPIPPLATLCKLCITWNEFLRKVSRIKSCRLSLLASSFVRRSSPASITCNSMLSLTESSDLHVLCECRIMI